MSDKKFHLSDEFIETIVRPQLNRIVERQIEDCRYSLVSFFRSYIFDLYYQKNKEGRYKLCDAKSINPQLEEYIMGCLLPTIGIQPGEHTIKQMEKAVGTLIKELLEYFCNNTDEYDEGGSIMGEDGVVYAVVNKFVEHSGSDGDNRKVVIHSIDTLP